MFVGGGVELLRDEAHRRAAAHKVGVRRVQVGELDVEQGRHHLARLARALRERGVDALGHALLEARVSEDGRREARRQEPLQLRRHVLHRLQAVRLEAPDLLPREHLERPLGHEERRARPHRLSDGARDVGVAEAGARVDGVHRVVKLLAEDRVDPRAAEQLAALARRLLHLRGRAVDGLRVVGAELVDQLEDEGAHVGAALEARVAKLASSARADASAACTPPCSSGGRWRMWARRSSLRRRAR